MKTNALNQKKKQKLEKRLFIINMILNTIGLLLPLMLIVSVLLYNKGGIFKTITPYLFFTVMVLYIGDMIALFIRDIKERGKTHEMG